MSNLLLAIVSLIYTGAAFDLVLSGNWRMGGMIFTYAIANGFLILINMKGST